MEWVHAETKRRGLEEEVVIRLNELMLEEQLANLRRKRGVSQAELAKIVGVSQPVIARIESGGVRNLTVGTIVRTAAALGGTVKIGIRPKQGTRRKVRKSA
jgi:transcriptional regulator with XRE-family HTH domain